MEGHLQISVCSGSTTINIVEANLKVSEEQELNCVTTFA